MCSNSNCISSTLSSFSDAMASTPEQLDAARVAAAMSQMGLTHTANGALAYQGSAAGLPTSLDRDKLGSLVDLLFQTVRGATFTDERLRSVFVDNPVLFAKLAAYVRDVRGGKGEKAIGKRFLTFLACLDPDNFISIVPMIPTWGSWQDLVFIAADASKVVRMAILSHYAAQLNADLAAKLAGKNYSLAAKWMCREKSSLNKTTKMFYRLAVHMGLLYPALRKILSTLSEGVTEVKMCSNNWDEIDLGAVPSQAMRKLKAAFERHCTEWDSWQAGLATGTTKVNASTLTPVQLLMEICDFRGRGVREVTPVTQAQWETLSSMHRDKLAGVGTSKMLIMCDVSGSMYSSFKPTGPNPIAVATSLALFCSQLGVESDPWRGLVMTFSTDPTFHVVNSKDNLSAQLTQLMSANWGQSTDLQKAFDLVLRKAREHKLAPAEMPEMIVIISDMQFNSACPGLTNLESIRQAYRLAGYVMPSVVFWNVAASTSNVPAQITDRDVALGAGYSPAILKSVLGMDDLTPVGVLINALSDPRYDAMDAFGTPAGGGAAVP